MRTIVIKLHDEMYDELVDAASRTAAEGVAPCSPEQFGEELIESALADRRLERIERRSTALAYGLRMLEEARAVTIRRT